MPEEVARDMFDAIDAENERVSSGRPNDLGVDSAAQPEMRHSSEYPVTVFGRKMRRFNPAWYSGRPWLEYSVERDAVFCFLCYKMSSFLTTRQAKADCALTIRGYRNW